MKPLYIFDLDGTLALIDHRRPNLKDEGLSSSEKWNIFERACVDDTPNQPVINTLNMLLSSGCSVWIFSGRSSAVRHLTLHWLRKFIPKLFEDDEAFDPDLHLIMRSVGDSQPDNLLKQGWLNSMLNEDRHRLVSVFDDRNKVVNMWRQNGISCFQVSPGNF